LRHENRKGKAGKACYRGREGGSGRDGNCMSQMDGKEPLSVEGQAGGLRHAATTGDHPAPQWRGPLRKGGEVHFCSENSLVD